MNDDILKSIETLESFVGAKLKIKRSTYEIVDYSHYFGFLLKKISGKKTNTVSPVSVGGLVDAIKEGKIELLSVKEFRNE